MSPGRPTTFLALALTSVVACGVEHEGLVCQAVGAVASALGDRSTSELWSSPALPAAVSTGSSGRIVQAAAVGGVASGGAARATVTRHVGER